MDIDPLRTLKKWNRILTLYLLICSHRLNIQTTSTRIHTQANVKLVRAFFSNFFFVFHYFYFYIILYYFCKGRSQNWPFFAFLILFRFFLRVTLYFKVDSERESDLIKNLQPKSKKWKSQCKRRLTVCKKNSKSIFHNNI